MSQKLYESVFRGAITGHVVGESSGGYPQVVVQVVGFEEYDPTEKVWLEFEDGNEVLGTAYLCLVGGKGEKTLNCKQVEKVLDWDGCSLEELEAIESEDKPVQFRTSLHEYKGKESIQIDWIDGYDEEPNRGLKKMDPKDVKNLQAKYASVFKATKKIASAASKAKGKGKDGGKPKTEPATEKPETETTTAAPPKRPKAGSTSTELMTMDEAWKQCQALTTAGHSADEVSDAWVAACEGVAPGKEDKEITKEEWAKICDIVVSKFILF